MKHEDIQLVNTVRHDDGTGISQKLARDDVPDSLITQLKCDKETGDFNADNEVEEHSVGDSDDMWVSELEYEVIG